MIRPTALAERCATMAEARPRVVGIGAAGVVVFALVAVFIGLPGLSGGQGGQEIRATFGPDTAIAGAYQLAPDRRLIDGAPVRVNGVDVGRVTSSELAADGRRTTVTMRVEDVTVRQDASAAIAFRTLLGGNLQIRLDPGSPSLPKLDRPIPESRTSDQVAVDDLFDPLQPTTREASRDAFRGLERGLSRPDATARALTSTATAADTIADGLGALEGTNGGDLARLVRATARLTAPLAAERGRLGALVRRGTQTLTVTARRREDIGRSFAALPATLSATDRTLARLTPALDALDPLAARLRPGARQLAPAARAARPTLVAADALLDRAEPLFEDLAPTVRRLGRLAGQARPLVDELRPTVERLNARILPFLGTRDPESKLKVYEAIGPFFSGANSAASGFDRNGYFFYFPDQPDARSLGANPCSIDLTEAEVLQCRSVLDVLRDVFPLRKASR